MKIALCQLNFIIADIQGNANKIIKAIEEAQTNHCDLAIFSELSICGYPPDDLLDYPHFVDQCLFEVNKIAAHVKDLAVIIGSPSHNKNKFGRKLFNSAFVIQNGEIIHQTNKTLLPTYDIFNEARYFEPNTNFETFIINGKKLAISICEDLWNEMEIFNYQLNPIEELNKLSPDLIINISASPYNKGKQEQRRKIICNKALITKTPIVYVNQVGAHTDIIFDGCSMFINGKGEIIHQLPAFESCIKFIETDIQNTETNTSIPENTEINQLYQAITFGLKNYFQSMGFKKAILGSSGGIDSALVQAIASDVLGAENVLAVMMPSKFSSQGSVSDAIQLSENLGNPHQVIPINDIFNAFENSLQPIFNDLPFNIAEENIQARSRAVLLMAISNKLGYILLNTSNKSEMSVGYTTLYGDMCGSISVIGDLYKTEVYQLANYINRNNEVIPESIINKAPSAELRPDQKDSDSLPEYKILDDILELYIEKQKSIEEICHHGFEKILVEKIIRLVNNNEFKRFQAPPILRVSSKSFGRGRVIPLVSKW
ncbi:MAG: NAD+ synthase [Bacteroidota bacterium]|nr:NAD+ synthase [Bacteroidota bacterium]